MCTWTLTSAGITVLPARSTRCVPLGTATRPAGPMARMAPFCTTNDPRSIGGAAVPMMSRAFS